MVEIGDPISPVATGDEAVEVAVAVIVDPGHGPTANTNQHCTAIGKAPIIILIDARHRALGTLPGEQQVGVTIFVIVTPGGHPIFHIGEGGKAVFKVADTAIHGTAGDKLILIRDEGRALFAFKASRSNDIHDFALHKGPGGTESQRARACVIAGAGSPKQTTLATIDGQALVCNAVQPQCCIHDQDHRVVKAGTHNVPAGWEALQYVKGGDDGLGRAVVGQGDITPRTDGGGIGINSPWRWIDDPR